MDGLTQAMFGCDAKRNRRRLSAAVAGRSQLPAPHDGEDTRPFSLRKNLAWLVLVVMACQGCAHGIVTSRIDITENAIPAYRLPDAFQGRGKDKLVPIDFTWLRHPPVREHMIDAGDVLGLYVEKVLDSESQRPAVYFPPRPIGEQVVASPSVGHPVEVSADGQVVLPFLAPIRLTGKTLQQAADTIRDAYLAKGILRPDGQQVTVSLIKARSVTVFVVREDSDPPNQTLSRREVQIASRRGSSDVVELSAYQNDLLNALSMSGGLPGVDGFNEVWILRNNDASPQNQLLRSFEAGSSPQDVVDQFGTQFVRIPLRVCPGQAAPFQPSDVILQDGDVVFIESREIEYFLTGGLISGGKYPLPRDHDVDVVEAIAIANANVNGPAGNSTATNFRSGPGNIVAPTDVVVVRQLDNGEQIKILVDLKVAMNDPRERIRVLPRDLIVMRYKPSELWANIALNFVNFNYAIPTN